MTNVVALQSGGKIAGIVPQSIDDVFRLAKAVSLSGLAPASMNQPEQITVAILHGLEIGLPPMQAIQRIAVINGRPTLWGDAVPALILAKGFKLREWMEGTADDRVAHCEVTRPDGTVYSGTFSVADAKQAKLWQTSEKVKRKDKNGNWYEKDNDSPWFRFQNRMLQMRARGFACRDGAADVLAGLYLREEIEEEPRDITPTEAKETVLPPLASEKKALPPVVGSPAEDVSDLTEDAREQIEDAVSVEMLEHIRETNPDADWPSLQAAFDDKRDELKARGA